MASFTSNYQIYNKNCNSKFLLLCDHATNHIPNSISKRRLGLTKEQLRSHIAYDIGAKETALRISQKMSSPLIMSNFSRLIIDPNRSKEDPTLVMQINDGFLIPGNFNLSKVQVKSRIKNFYDPYHQAIENFIHMKKKENCTPCLVSLHSFTSQLNLQAPRPWHVGVLWNQDRRMSDLVLNELSKLANICVGRNKPYAGNLKGDTLSKHGTENKLPHVLIEIRNDLIKDEEGQEKWAKIIEIVLNKSISQMKEWD